MSGSKSRWESWGYAGGLALLYTSAFYLPGVGVPQSYWYPYVGREILFPAVIGTVILVPMTRSILLRYLSSHSWSPVEQIPVAILTLIALLGGFSAVGYSATDLAISMAGNDATVDATRWSRIGVSSTVFAIVAAALTSLKNRRETFIRILSTIGCAYAVLAVVRAEHSSTGPKAALGAAPSAAASPAHQRSASDPYALPREVVWIIFDEMDYNQTLGSPSLQKTMPNLLSLSKLGVSATHAYSPARDTEVSLPSLLLGVSPIGVRITSAGLTIHAHDGSFQPFDQAHSVFSRLPTGPDTGAVLGFYHPYCHVFPSVAPCIAMPEANVGRWFDALTPFGQPAIAAARWLPGSGSYLPGALFREYEPMYRISEETIREFPPFLSLQNHALIFMHVNLPHPPGDYSQRELHFATAGDDREAYRRNLRLVNDLIGVAIATLREEAKTHDVLLIISSDHWLRIDSPHQIQPIPWIAWHVGEDSGPVLDQQISTVHTSELVVDFLRGVVSRQQDILTWWQGRSFYPPLMPEHYDE
jgi:Sulfatase